MNTFVGFSDSAAPPGMQPNQDWMRVTYKEAAAAQAFEFHEVMSSRTPAGRVYKLRNRWPARSLSYTGWITYETPAADPAVQWFRANGNESEAALIRVEATASADELLLFNLGKADGASNSSL